MESANYHKLTSAHFHAWEKGLKTGMYYLRTRPAMDPIQFTVDMEKARKANDMVANDPSYKHTQQAVAPIYESVANAQQVMFEVNETAVKQDEMTIEQRAAEFGMTVEEFLQAQNACSLENPGACEMCGS